MRRTCAAAGALLLGVCPGIAAAQEEDELALLFEQTEVTTASKVAEPAALAPASITVITADDIRRSGARDLADVLRIVVGLELTRDQFGAVQIVSRGLLSPSESNQILLLLDGVPANIPYYGGASLVYDDLALAGVKRIEVVRGPGSALYGAAAFAGVIQVITRDGSEIDGIEAAAGGGSYPAAHASLVAGETFEGGAVAFRADVLASEGPRIRIERDAFSGISGPDGPVSNAPGLVPTGKEKVHLGLNARHGDTTLHASFLRNKRGVWLGNYVNVAEIQEYTQTDAYARLGWEKGFLGDRLKVGTAFTVQHHNEHERQQVFPQARFDADGNGDVEDYRAEPALDVGDLGSNSYSAEVQGSWNFAEKHVLLFGGSYQTVNQTDTYFHENWDDTGITQDRVHLPFNTAVTRQVGGVFVNDDWTIAVKRPGLHRLRVLAGIRYDYYDDDVAKKEDFGGGRHFDAVAPRAGLVYEPVPGVYAKYLYGRAFRPPSFRELYSDDPNVVVGRPTLFPETIDFHEVSVGLARPKVQAQVTAFLGLANDLLVSRNAGTTIEFGNLGASRTEGVEAEVRFSPAEGVRLFANATGQRVRLVDIDEDSPSVSTVKGNLGADLDLGGRAVVWLAATFLGDRRQPDFAIEDFSDRRVPSYVYATASLTLKTPIPGVEFQATGFNLLDAEIRDPFDGPALPEEIPGEGRSFWAEVRLKF